ncbi:MAG TPA: hypothetical protein PKH94_06475 [Bacteroidales bacterium]|nr:hypothetical protein [Bacteroidales bacterium]HNS46864.1 hypothetical protein [Bacteroidales bacterium]
MTGRIIRKQIPAWWRNVLLILLTGLLLFLSFNRHSKTGLHNYHSEIWGDKAGYYAYLPAAFIHSFNASRFPQGIDTATGNGFRLDSATNRVVTKYTCGVAVMMTPFFLTTHAIVALSDAPGDGFSQPYHKMINVAAVFYLMAGLILWYRVLRRYFSKGISLITITALFLGTTLFYYAVDETGMSHVYSFFLFSLYLFAVQRVFSESGSALKWIILTGLAAAMIILVRPVNAVFLPVIIFLDAATREEISKRISFLLKWEHVLILLFIAFLLFLPQLLYWNYTYDKFIIYTYHGEGFTNLLSPKITEYLFSTNNGLILYNPVLLFGFTGTILMLIRHKDNGRTLAVLLLVIIYLFSSWWNWYYGCGYGNRSFTEYTTVMALPFGYLANTILNRPRKALKWCWIILVCILVVLNLKMIYSWDGCWYGVTWDWNKFLDLLVSPPK